MAALIARVRDFQLAEDALHDAAASALIHWARAVPDRPIALASTSADAACLAKRHAALPV